MTEYMILCRRTRPIEGLWKVSLRRADLAYAATV